MNWTYAVPPGGHPPQSQLTADRAVITDAYAVIPAGVLRDIVTSKFPFWQGTRAWVLARPLSGLAETFSQYCVEIAPGGGSQRPEPAPDVQSVLFVLAGEITICLDGEERRLQPGGYAYLPPSARWTLANLRDQTANMMWVRKRYQAIEGVAAPKAFFANERDITPSPMPGTEGAWATTRFVDPDDMAHDMHVNIVTFQPGGSIPFAETHVMEHGLYILQGKAVYRLNDDWVEVEAGDFLWLRAFCPQACVAGGPEPFRYLLYKDVNRHATFARGLA